MRRGLLRMSALAREGGQAFSCCLLRGAGGWKWTMREESAGIRRWVGGGGVGGGHVYSFTGKALSAPGQGTSPCNVASCFTIAQKATFPFILCMLAYRKRTGFYGKSREFGHRPKCKRLQLWVVQGKDLRLAGGQAGVSTLTLVLSLLLHSRPVL